MAFCEVEKVDGYTIMANYHLRDRRLSLKAKGLLSMIFSLPPNWDMSVEGLAYISLECSDTIYKTVKELETAGYSTRIRERRPDGKMGGIKYCISQKPNITGDNSPEPKPESPTPKKPNLESLNQDLPSLEKSGQLNKDTTKKELQNKELSKKQSINPADAEPIGLDKIEEMRELIQGNIEYDIISQQYDKQQLDEIVEIMVECVTTTKPTVTIGKEDLPSEVVKSRFLKIGSDHIEYIFWSLHRNATKIRNIKAYLKTVIYNAPTTISNFYAAEVNHDMNGEEK